MHSPKLQINILLLCLVSLSIHVLQVFKLWIFYKTFLPKPFPQGLLFVLSWGHPHPAFRAVTGHVGRAWWEPPIFGKVGATAWAISGASSKGRSADCQRSHGGCGVSGCCVTPLYPPIFPHSNPLYSTFSCRYFNLPEETCWIHLTGLSDLQDQALRLVFQPC